MGTPAKGVRGSLPNPHRDQIVKNALDEILDGKTLAQIAVGHGVSKQTLNHWLLDLGDEYRDLRNAYIDTRLSNAEEMIEQAEDQLALARARELLRSAQWTAERRDRARYGVQPVASASGSVEITINVGGVNPQGITIDAE